MRISRERRPLGSQYQKIFHDRTLLASQNFSTNLTTFFQRGNEFEWRHFGCIISSYHCFSDSLPMSPQSFGTTGTVWQSPTGLPHLASVSGKTTLTFNLSSRSMFSSFLFLFYFSFSGDDNLSCTLYITLYFHRRHSLFCITHCLRRCRLQRGKTSGHDGL